MSHRKERGRSTSLQRLAETGRIVSSVASLREGFNQSRMTLLQMYLDALSGSGTKVTVVTLEAINASNHIIRRTREYVRKAEITDPELRLDAIHQDRVHVPLDPGLAAGLKVVIEVNRYETVASEADEEFVLRDNET